MSVGVYGHGCGLVMLLHLVTVKSCFCFLKEASDESSLSSVTAVKRHQIGGHRNRPPPHRHTHHRLEGLSHIHTLPSRAKDPHKHALSYDRGKSFDLCGSILLHWRPHYRHALCQVPSTSVRLNKALFP